MLEDLPAENFMFFSPSMREHPAAEFLSRDLSASPCVPIPIDTARLRPPAGRPVDGHKIVSVARLAPYYTYIRQMIRVIRELRDGGHDFTYHSYGDGELRADLEAEARDAGVDDAVFFHGAIPYDRFAEAVGDAFAYIGIGTGLLEAAACGVPALVAIDSHPGAATHGFIHETTGNTIGGHVEGHPEYPIAERLLWLASRTESEYAAVEQGSLARAAEFGLERLLPAFVDHLANARPYSPSISRAQLAIARFDWMAEAVMLKLGARDVLLERFMRPSAG
jgi:glycosyltransferase involved in cell wall biosynthesis